MSCEMGLKLLSMSETPHNWRRVLRPRTWKMEAMDWKHGTPSCWGVGGVHRGATECLTHSCEK